MIDVSGLIAVCVFYVLILGVGLWAAWKRRNISQDAKEIMVSGRSMGYTVGIMTITATWVGGGYINGSAEVIFKSGLFWCQAPIGFSLSLFIGGLFFAKPMREAGYVTMLDPFQELYGPRWGSFLFWPAFLGELLGAAGVLAALGSTLSVILGAGVEYCIWGSAAIAVSYTLFGGLTSVAYTDVVQLTCIFLGLWLVVPFASTHEHVGKLSEVDWMGTVPDNPYEWSLWVEYYVLLILGGIPWQIYFQRVLAAKTARQAQLFSYFAALGCLIMVIPACFIGVIAKATDWEKTSYNNTITPDTHSSVLPLVIRYLTPQWVTFMGLGAVSAAVMSSADSCILSAASMFSRNIYVNVFRPKASNLEVVWVVRISLIISALSASCIAIYNTSVYGLFVSTADFVFVMLFPQFTCAVHFPTHVNIYGSSAAYIVGFFLRLFGGDEVLGIPVIIKYPFFDEKSHTQMFPFRTLSMIITFIVLIGVSKLAKNCMKETKNFDLELASKRVSSK